MDKLNVLRFRKKKCIFNVYGNIHYRLSNYISKDHIFLWQDYDLMSNVSVFGWFQLRWHRSWRHDGRQGAVWRRTSWQEPPRAIHPGGVIRRHRQLTWPTRKDTAHGVLLYQGEFVYLCFENYCYYVNAPLRFKRVTSKSFLFCFCCFYNVIQRV